MTAKPALRPLALCAALCTLAAVPSARAQVLRRPLRWAHVAVEHAPCARGPYSVARYASLLRIELGGDPSEGVFEGSDEVGATLTDEPSACTPAATEVTLTYAVPAVRFELRRVVSLAGLSPAARPRVLALAAAELLRTRVPEPAPPAPVSPPTPPTREDEDPPVAPARTSTSAVYVPPAPLAPPAPDPSAPWQRLTFALSGVTRWHVPTDRPGILLGGVRLAALVPVPRVRWLQVHAGVGFVRGGRDHALGTVSANFVPFSVGVSVVAPLGVRLPLAVRFAVFGELAVTDTAATAAYLGVRASSRLAVTSTLTTLATLELALGSRARLFAGIEAGTSLLGAEATADEAVLWSTAGSFVGLTLGARVAL